MFDVDLDDAELGAQRKPVQWAVRVESATSRSALKQERCVPFTTTTHASDQRRMREELLYPFRSVLGAPGPPRRSKFLVPSPHGLRCCISPSRPQACNHAPQLTSTAAAASKLAMEGPLRDQSPRLQAARRHPGRNAHRRDACAMTAPATEALTRTSPVIPLYRGSHRRSRRAIASTSSACGTPALRASSSW